MASWVVTLAVGEPRFQHGVERLAESLRHVGFAGTFEAWNTLPPGCPPHLDVPFAFKPYCLADARAAGAARVLWLDSSCIAVRPVDRLFAEIERKGYLVFRNRRFVVGEWAGDAALRRFEVSRRGQRVSADPRVRGHRHDQTVAGLLAYRLGMGLTTRGLIVRSRMPRVTSPRTVVVNLRQARRRRRALLGRLARWKP